MKAARLIGQIDSDERELDSHIRASFETTGRIVDGEDAIKALLRGPCRGKALINCKAGDTWEVLILHNGELHRIPAAWAHEEEIPEPAAKPTTGKADAKPCNGRCHSNGTVHEFLIGGASVLNGGLVR